MRDASARLAAMKFNLPIPPLPVINTEIHFEFDQKSKVELTMYICVDPGDPLIWTSAGL